MKIEIWHGNGHFSFEPDDFDKLRTFILTGQKIQGIKLMRELSPMWGLKEAKDFVEACYFGGNPNVVTPAVYVAPGRNLEFNNFLYDLKDDLRAALVTKEENRASFIVDLFARVCSTLAKG